MSDIRSDISLLVYPNAGKNEVIDFTGGDLRVKVAAPPVKGKANKELLDFLSHTLDISKSSLAIIKGQTSRHKIISVQGLSQEDIIKRLLP